MINRKKARLLFLILIAGWMLVIFLFSAKVSARSELDSGRITDQVIQIINPYIKEKSSVELQKITNNINFIVRKCAHATEYAILAVLLSFYFNTFQIKEKKILLLAILISICYAATDEFHQLFVPGRSGQVKDVLIDTMGASCGAAGFLLIMKWYHWRKLWKHPFLQKKI